MTRRQPLIAALCLAALACSDSGNGPTSPNQSTDAGSQSADAAGGTADAVAVSCDVPVESDSLFAYLKAGTYKAFPAETTVHESAGPHGRGVRTYISPSLEASLREGAAEHPPCAAMIKELYADAAGTTLSGWAAAVKVQKTSDDGRGWYWYEVLSTTNGDAPVAAGAGVALCAGCHAGGRDFVQTTYPLK